MQRAFKMCRHVGCSELTRENYCPRHKTTHEWIDKQQKQEWDKKYDKERGSAASRGYDQHWQQFRIYYIARHPLCQRCLGINKLTPTELIHHIIPLAAGGSKYDERNLIPLCRRCHEVVEGRSRESITLTLKGSGLR